MTTVVPAQINVAETPGPALVRAALDALRHGEPVVVVDDGDREDEGDLILAAELANAERVAFILRHTSGVLCVGLPGDRLDALKLPLMVPESNDLHRTAFTVSVDARQGTTTGISAADRSATIRALMDPRGRPEDFARPGHVFPLRARSGGVLVRRGHTEAAVDLTRLAGLTPGGALCEVVSADGAQMARRPQLERLAARYRLVLISVADLVRYRIAHEKLVTVVAESEVATRFGSFRAITFHSALDGREHVALVRGQLAGASELPVHVHRECLAGDVLGSVCCCGQQLEAAMAEMSARARGVVIYLRGQGRCDLGPEPCAHGGPDTAHGNTGLPSPLDSTDYATAAQILWHFDVASVRLLTNDRHKGSALAGFGIQVIELRPLLATPRQRTGPASLGVFPVDVVQEGGGIHGSHEGAHNQPDVSCPLTAM